MGTIFIMGSFVADCAFRAARLPAWGETLLGESFLLGPGGKGSNQAVAAARAAAADVRVRMLTRLGDDAFGQMARAVWRAAGVDDTLVATTNTATGAAAILLDAARGENAIVVVPGASYTLSVADVDAARSVIAEASILMTQLELPLATVEHGLRMARAAGVTTVLNPAPAAAITDALLAEVDYLVPNETEAAQLSGLLVESLEDAAQAAGLLLERGAQCVIVTLGARGALLCQRGLEPVLVTAFSVGAVVDTTGAGDAFCGGFAVALAEGRALRDAVRFGCAAAGIAVTRAGTAASMPQRAEIEALLARS
jgi:ribokinase